MKNYTTIFSTLLLAFGFLIQANGQNEEEKKVKIEIKVDKDGEVTNYVKEFNPGDIEVIRKELESMEGVDVDVIVEQLGGEDNIMLSSAFANSEGGEEHPFLGVMGTTDDEGQVVIEKVIKGSAAEKAGLKDGDIVLEADGMNLSDYEQLVDIIRSKEAGDKLGLKVDREGQELNLEAELKLKKVRRIAWSSSSTPGENEEVVIMNGAGSNDVFFSSKSRPYVGISYSSGEDDLLITKVMEGSPAEKAGLLRGDFITKIDGVGLSEKGLLEFLDEADEGQEVKFTLNRGGKKVEKTVKLGEKKSLSGNFFDNKEVRFNKSFVFITKLEEEEQEVLSKALGRDITEMEKLEDIDLNVFPNPSNGEFIINVNNQSDAPAILSIFNIKGEQLYNVELNTGNTQEEVDISKEAAGNYFVVLQQGDGSITEKIIKQ